MLQQPTRLAEAVAYAESARRSGLRKMRESTFHSPAASQAGAYESRNAAGGQGFAVTSALSQEWK